MEMKATELMIGDWVCLKDDTKYELPQKVDGILTDDISLEGEGFLGGVDGLIRPIPITPEILEKNGWNLDTVLQCYTSTPLWLYGEGIINLLLQFPAKQSAGSLEIFDNQKIRSLFDFTWKDRLYIHELQHTLRLCGLDKLADNFKV